MKSLETALERLMFGSRWLLAPLYVGLVLSIILLLIKFAKEFYFLAGGIMTAESGDVIIGILSAGLLLEGLLRILTPAQDDFYITHPV